MSKIHDVSGIYVLGNPYKRVGKKNPFFKPGRPFIPRPAPIKSDPK